MKAKKIAFALAAGLLIAVVAFSCQKSHYCLCVSTETPVNDTMIVNTDNGMSCKRIMQLGIQVQDSGRYKLDSIHSYTCTKIKKDSLSNYHNLHVQ